MFNIGGGEFLVIALIALIVLGPQRLPDAARQVGKAMGELRRLSTGFQNELKDAFTDSELTAAPTPRRHALTAMADTTPTDATVATAVAAVSQQPAARRAPLKAAAARRVPIKAAQAPAARKATPIKRATPIKKAASTKAAPAPKAPRPPSGG